VQYDPRAWRGTHGDGLPIDGERVVRGVDELSQRDGEFVGARQLLEVTQRELLEEERRRAVEQRPADALAARWPTTSMSPRSCSDLSTAPTFTPRISSISARPIGCRYAMMASVSSAAADSRAGARPAARARWPRCTRGA
jgi:hypothetical protein